MYYFIIKKYLQVLTWNLKQNKKKEKKYNNCSSGRKSRFDTELI